MNTEATQNHTQPKYKFGQAVKVNIDTEDKKTGLKFSNKVIMYITAIYWESGTTFTYFRYGLSTEIPQPYGSAPVKIYVDESDIVI